MQEPSVLFRLSDLEGLAPESLIPIFITLVLSFLIGLEREEHSAGRFYNFGGVRTFPIIGLCGYMMAKLTSSQPFVLGVGVLVLGALMWLSYRKKLELSSSAGMTSEVSGLFTFLLGALVAQRALWEATALAVTVLMLLELKGGLEALARKIPPEEIFTFTRFLLISAVILPIVPNREFTNLHFNPFNTWLVVVAISGLSYGAYVFERALGARRGIVWAAILGGIYSSTSTTVLLAKRSQTSSNKSLLSGAIVLASGFMYFRLVILLWIFNWSLGMRLTPAFLGLGFLFSAVGAGWLIYKMRGTKESSAMEFSRRNPLELQFALIFAALFSAMGVIVVLVIEYLGEQGIYVLAALTGLTDVDAFVMSLTQSSGNVVAETLAARGIIVATSANNLMKGLYAAAWGRGSVRGESSWVLMGLGVLSLGALFFV